MPKQVVLTFPPSAEAPPLAETPELIRLAAEALGVERDGVGAVRPRRVSFDGRRRRRVWRAELDVWGPGEAAPPAPATTPPTISAPSADAPHAVIVGSGPAGLFAALDLLAGGWNATVLERGADAQTRRRPIAELNRGRPADPDCNYCFGEGGAGTYSDGKLYTRAAAGDDVREVFEQLVAHGAPPEILVHWRPHIGSNRLPKVVTAMRETIRHSGGQVLFGARAEKLRTRAEGERRRVQAVVYRDLATGEPRRLDCDAVVLATGHSALDAVHMARRAGASLAPKGFSLGVRIEHPQPWLDERQYGGLRAECELPAAFYEITAQAGGRGVYSFCMCPGGFIVPAMTAPNRVVVNGMSLSRRDSPFANSGLVVQVEPEDWCGGRGVSWGWLDLLGTDRLPDRPEDDPLFGIRLQVALEERAAQAGGGNNRAPSQRADAFADGQKEAPAPLPTSYRPGLAPVDLAAMLPRGVARRMRSALRDFDRKLPGYASDIGQLVGVETRTSSPVRVARDEETLESPEVAGLYPAGEGAGYAGGIVSAALDGRRVARSALASR
ncbi:MAG: FAD-dependent protein [Planctomycetota bacterium]